MSTPDFETSYKRLNKAQKEAVDAIDGPVMVIAGPGTGKTTILTLRIANILKKTDTPAHGILAITYTDAGVKAMRQKLRDTIGNRAHEVAIHTFHSFASAMIAEYQDHFIEVGDLRQMSSVEQESLIRKIIEDPSLSLLRPMGRPDAYVTEIMGKISEAKKEDFSPEKVSLHAMSQIEKVKDDESSISTRGASKGKLKADAEDKIEKFKKTALFAEVYKRYEHEKKQKRLRDYDDLIIQLLDALKDDQLLLRLIQERFLYVMVDEHQDTNDSQNQIIQFIAEFFDTPNVFIVGDEKQAIYRFQGASVENFLNLKKHWKDVKEIRLETNYRSHQAILDSSFAMIENNYDGDEHGNLRIKLKAGGTEKLRPVDVVNAENAAAMERYLVDELETLTRKEPKATIAVITRRNRDLERVLRLLESNGIPVSSERSVDIFHHPVGVAFFELIEYLNDPSKNESLGRTLAAGMWRSGFEDSAALFKMLRSGKTADVGKKIPALLHLQRKMLNDGAVGFLIHAAEESGFTGLVARDPAYIHVWRGIIALAESLAREGDISNPSELMRAMLAYRLSAESKTVKVSVGAPDLPIQAMTAHGSKGLEFDYVFMPYATEEAWVGRRHGSSFILPELKANNHDVSDMRRLFYVAITRARKHAVILSALEESDGKMLTPLQFISELDAKSIATIQLPRLDVELPRADPHKKNPNEADAYSTKIVSLAKEVLLDSGLSVTALNHFLKCPNEFLYESILRLPQAPSAAAEKGTAMHAAISKVWQSDQRLKSMGTVDGKSRTAIEIQDGGTIGQVDGTAESSDRVKWIERTLIDAIAEYLDDSFLPANEKDAVKKELLEDAPIVAKALAPHFAVKGPIFTERSVRTSFDGSFKGERITIPIHGKLDAIVESADAVEVFDYKTRQAMSVNAIKGETKSGSGDYFRQLVFYKILLSDEPRWRSRAIIPALVFVKPDDKGRCPIVTLPIEATDIDAVKKTVQAVIESVWSGALAHARCGERDCEWCGLRSLS